MLVTAYTTFGQETIVSGKITDANTGDPIPLANVIIQGTTEGTNTDFTGNFKLTSNKVFDSITVSYIGYLTKTKAVNPGSTQTINFQLKERIENLDEMVFVAEENPAFSIMRKVVDNKALNDKRSLKSLSI